MTNYYTFGFDIGLDSIACAIVENGVVIHVNTILRSQYVPAKKSKGQPSYRERYASYFVTLSKVARAAARVYNGKLDRSESNVGVYIETPFLGVNPKTFRSLARVEGEVIAEFERNGVITLDVKPSEWQKEMLGATKPRPLLEKLSMQEARRQVKEQRRFSRRVFTVHEADAVNIACYGHMFDKTLRNTFADTNAFVSFGKTIARAASSAVDFEKTLTELANVLKD